MAITRYDPNTIWLGGNVTQVGDVVASEAITPGHLVERFNSSGTAKFRKCTLVTGATLPAFALNQSMLNKGVDDAYASGDLVEVAIGSKGATFWAIIASGQNIVAGARLESAGNGTLRALASGVAIAQAVRGVDNSAGPGDARIPVEVI
jgi:hypothetical protein